MDHFFFGIAKMCTPEQVDIQAAAQTAIGGHDDQADFLQRHARIVILALHLREAVQRIADRLHGMARKVIRARFAYAFERQRVEHRFRLAAES